MGTGQGLIKVVVRIDEARQNDMTRGVVFLIMNRCRATFNELGDLAVLNNNASRSAMRQNRER